MSARIAELAEEARLEVPSNLTVGEWVEQYNQILGRKIIDDCVKICQQGTDTQTTSSGAVGLIRLHFGIEP